MKEFFMRHRIKIIPAMIVGVLMLIFVFAFDLGWMAPVIIVFLSIPLLLFCFVRAFHPGMRGLPADAIALPPAERDEILRELAGQWDIVPTHVPQNSLGNVRNIAFSQAYVNGEVITLSGGPHGRVQTQRIFLSRTPAGTLYLDNLGSYVTVWDKANNEIHINNALNMTLIWRRPGGAYAVGNQQPVAPVTYQPVPAMFVQPVPAARAPAVVVLPSWWQTMTDPSGRVYYKNNYKGTTSWTPPTAQQIADETREKNASGEGVEGPPPPAYNPGYTASAPPHYS